MQKQIVRNESMRTVIRYAFWLLSLFLMSEIQAVTPQKAPLKLGAERMDVVTRLLKDKQVGISSEPNLHPRKAAEAFAGRLVGRGYQHKESVRP